MSTQSPIEQHQTANTVMSHIYNHFFIHESSTGIRILIIVLMAIIAHLAVKAIRRVSEWMLVRGHGTGRSSTR
jgi:hypothetical protein